MHWTFDSKQPTNIFNDQKFFFVLSWRNDVTAFIFTKLFLDQIFLLFWSEFCLEGFPSSRASKKWLENVTSKIVLALATAVTCNSSPACAVDSLRNCHSAVKRRVERRQHWPDVNQLGGADDDDVYRIGIFEGVLDALSLKYCPCRLRDTDSAFFVLTSSWEQYCKIVFAPFRVTVPLILGFATHLRHNFRCCYRYEFVLIPIAEGWIKPLCITNSNM